MLEFVNIKKSKFMMGSNFNDGFEIDLESPQVRVDIDDFSISTTCVTNKEFQKFIMETGYITEAEILGNSYVFHLQLSEEQKKYGKQLEAVPWWYEIEDASWRMPEGKGSTIRDRMDHPVVHVTWNDAMAFCEWAGFRLPTEAEWEFASRGGYENLRFPWGNDLEKNGKFWANTWQGRFPENNTGEDGYIFTAPVKSYEPNGFGLYQMIGNVWEWCLNPGRIVLDEFVLRNTSEFLKDAKTPSRDLKALRGGSFLCHESYCVRYRNAGRNANTANSSTSNTGFRVVKITEE